MAGGKSKTVSATVKYGTERIPIEVDFGKRRRLYITVSPDQSVQVKAPRRESMERVIEFVRSRAAWIDKHRRRFAQFKPLPLARRYANGEKLLYLGRQYTLKVVQNAGEDVKLRGRFLSVSTADRRDTDRIEALVEWWYVEHAWALFASRLDKCYESAPQLMIEYPDLRVRHMVRSWGTCSAKGWVNLNWELVKTPVCCIDYVITHELCHLRHRNHSKAFYRLLGRCMPDWRRRKERLDRYVI